MKKLIYLIALILVFGLIVAGCDNPVVPPAEQSELENQTKADTTITVILKDSQGGFVEGGKVYLGVGGWPYKGETNTEGVLTFAYSGGASMRVKVTAPNYGGTQTTPYQDITVNSTFELNTERVVIQLKDHNGDPLNDGVVKAGFGGWPVIGTTGANGAGTLYHEMFPSTLNFRMSYHYGTETKSHVHAKGAVLVFQTGLVDLQFSGVIQHGVGGWPAFSNPCEMLLIEHRFAFSGSGYPRTEMRFTPIAGGVLEKSIFYIRLCNSSGAGIEGGTAKLGVGGWPSIGSTNSSGVLLYARDGKVGNMRVRMTAPDYGGTQTSPTQNHATNSFYDFQTFQAVIQLKNSFGALTNGGVVRVGFGGWPVIGETGDDGDGTLYHEMFPGTYKFRMTYNSTTKTKSQNIATPVVFQTELAVIELRDHNGSPLSGGVVRFGVGGWPVIGTTNELGQVTRELLPGTYKFRMSYNYGTETKKQNIATPIVFQTGLVSLQFSGTIKHGVGGWPAYTGPTEMLPIQHRFRITACGYSEEFYFAPTPGGVLEKSIVILRLLDNIGNGIAGGTAKWADGSWNTIPGTTDADGLLIYPIPGLKGNLRIVMTYHQGSVELNQHQPTNSCYLWQTVEAAIKLIDDEGNGLAGGKVDQGGGYWEHHGYTDSNGEFKLDMFPGAYKFRIGYNNTSQEKVQDISTDVTFQTGKVISAGDAIKASLGGSWITFTHPSMQLLPGTYTFVFTSSPTSESITVTAALITNIR